MSNQNESGQPEVPDSTPRRRPNPYAGMYGLPAPAEGVDGATQGYIAGEHAADADATSVEPPAAQHTAPPLNGRDVIKPLPQYGAQSGYRYGEADQATPAAPASHAAPGPINGPANSTAPESANSTQPYVFGEHSQNPGQAMPPGPNYNHPAGPPPTGAPTPPTLLQPYSDRLPAEYFQVPPRTGARDDVEVSLMEAPWYQPNPQFGPATPPSAANNWLGANSFAALWGRGWGLWRRAAGPLTLAFLLFIAVPWLPMVPAFSNMIDVMASANLETMAATDTDAQSALMESVYAQMPSPLHLMLTSLLLVIGSIPFTNGLVTLARVGSVTMREMWSFKHAIPIAVVGLVSVLLSMNSALAALQPIYLVLTFFAGYIIVAEGLSLRRAFTRPFSVAVGNMSSVLLLLVMWLLLVGGGMLGFAMLGIFAGTFMTVSAGVAAGLWVAILLSFASMVITYPVWLCMVTTTALRATKRTDFVREILQRAK